MRHLLLKSDLHSVYCIAELSTLCWNLLFRDLTIIEGSGKYFLYKSSTLQAIASAFSIALHNLLKTFAIFNTFGPNDNSIVKNSIRYYHATCGQCHWKPRAVMVPNFSLLSAAVTSVSAVDKVGILITLGSRRLYNRLWSERVTVVKFAYNLTTP